MKIKLKLIKIMDKLPNELLLKIFEFVFSGTSPLSTIIINKHLVNIQNKVKKLILLNNCCDLCCYNYAEKYITHNIIFNGNVFLICRDCFETIHSSSYYSI